MKVKTSYFGNRRIPSSYIKVSISRFPPENFTGMQYLKLAPPAELLRQVKQTHDTQTYTRLYNELVLSRISREEIFEDLQKISDLNNGKDIVLLCYEKNDPHIFCHRHLVADYLNIEELGEDDSPITSLF